MGGISSFQVIYNGFLLSVYEKRLPENAVFLVSTGSQMAGKNPSDKMILDTKIYNL